MSSPNKSDSAVNTDEYILETAVKWAWLEEKLCAALHTTARFGEHRSVQQTGIGKGYLSVVGRIHPQWTLQDKLLPKTVIVKIASLRTMLKVMEDSQQDETSKKFMESVEKEDLMGCFEKMLKNVHNNEIAMYTLMECNQLQLKVPKTYVMQPFDEHSTDGVIVMEDIGQTAISATSLDILTVHQVYQVIDELVKLHKFSYENSQWKEMISHENVCTLMKDKNFENITESFIKSVESLDDSLPALIDRILVEKSIFDTDTFDNLSHKFGIPAVIAHGDLWSSNVMWNVDKGQRTLVGVLDWQVSHPGCVSEDIARFISCSMTAKDRREHWRDILKYYYDKLGENMHKDLPFSYQQLEESFIWVCPLAMIMISGIFSAVIIKQANPDEAMLAIARDKAIGVMEDVMYFYSLRPKSHK